MAGTRQVSPVSRMERRGSETAAVQGVNAMDDDGYVIVISSGEAGRYRADTYRVSGAGMLAVVAMLENPNPAFDVLVRAEHLNVRSVPAGEVVGLLDGGMVARVHPPTVRRMMGAYQYEWGRIESPLRGWIALGTGLAERVLPPAVDKKRKVVDKSGKGGG